MSLFLRLGIGLMLILGICWGAATLSARYQTRETINELFDTQQLLLAKRLLTLNFTSVNETSLPRSKKYCPITGAG